MRPFAALFALACALATGPSLAVTPPADPPPRLAVLAFHDVRADASTGTDPDAITPDTFIAKMEWLKGNGWAFVSLDQVIRARAGQESLPNKAVLLTFDDGLKSAYTTVFPLLQAYHAPAAMAVVDAWVNLPAGTTMDYNGERCTRDCFVTWDQLREMDRSGLVQVISHSDNLHHGLAGNPQGSQTPAGRTLAYAQGHYETQVQFEARVRADLVASQTTLTRELGHPVPAIAWPYGAYTAFQVRLAQEQGMLTLGLSADAPTPLHGPVIERILVGYDMDLSDMADMLTLPRTPISVRALQVPYPELAGANDQARDQRLGQLLDRVARLRPTEVWFTDLVTPQGAAFPTTAAPLSADYAGRAAWQLRTRARVSVGAVLPDWPASALLPLVSDLAAHVALQRLILTGQPSPALQAEVLARFRQWRPAGEVNVLGEGPRAPDIGTVLAAADAPATQPPGGLARPPILLLSPQANEAQARAGLLALLGRGFNRLGYAWDRPLAPGTAWQDLRPGIAATAYPYRVP